VEEEERRKIEPEEVIFNDFFQGTKAGFSPLFFKDILPPTTLERYLKPNFIQIQSTTSFSELTSTPSCLDNPLPLADHRRGD
jgi:hypothetical protein